MKTIQIIFHPDATIEQRKTAINNAMERLMPFKFKTIEVEGPDIGRIDYTGGFTQLLLATKANITYSLKKQSYATV